VEERCCRGCQSLARYDGDHWGLLEDYLHSMSNRRLANVSKHLSHTRARFMATLWYTHLSNSRPCSACRTSHSLCIWRLVRSFLCQLSLGTMHQSGDSFLNLLFFFIRPPMYTSPSSLGPPRFGPFFCRTRRSWLLDPTVVV